MKKDMKKTLVLGLVVTTMFSCAKDDDGFMYKANHSYKNRNGKTEYMSDYFRMEYKDSSAAVTMYMGTEAYRNISTYTDSTWITYHCTYQEWLESGKEGWTR